MSEKPDSVPTAPALEWFEKAFLIYGPRKGGTTLLQNLLDGDDSLFVYPVELKLKQLLFPKKNRPSGARYYAHRSRVRTVPLPGFDLDLYQKRLSALAESASEPPLKEMIRHDIGYVIEAAPAGVARQPRCWAAKEVGGRTGGIVRWWLESFAGAKVVFIVRDPLMVTRAVLRTRRRTKSRQSLADLVYETLDPLRVMKAQERLLADPRVLGVAYEDLVEDPARTMARIAGFLGVPYREGFTQPSIFGQSVVVLTASRKSKEVFKEEADWRDGLTWRERFVVRLASLYARSRLDLRLDYWALRQRLRA